MTHVPRKDKIICYDKRVLPTKTFTLENPGSLGLNGFKMGLTGSAAAASRWSRTRTGTRAPCAGVDSGDGHSNLRREAPVGRCAPKQFHGNSELCKTQLVFQVGKKKIMMLLERVIWGMKLFLNFFFSIEHPTSQSQGGKWQHFC